MIKLDILGAFFSIFTIILSYFFMIIMMKKVRRDTNQNSNPHRIAIINALIFAFWLMIWFSTGNILSYKMHGDTSKNSNPRRMGQPPIQTEPISWQETASYIPKCLIGGTVFALFLSSLMYLCFKEQSYKKIESYKIKVEMPIMENIYIKISENEDYRPISAIYIAEKIYKLQGEEQYTQLNEKWQFLPGDTVVVEWQHVGRLYCMVAIEKVPKSYCVNNPKSEINKT